jgi:hypothetical protein
MQRVQEQALPIFRLASCGAQRPKQSRRPFSSASWGQSLWGEPAATLIFRVRAENSVSSQQHSRSCLGHWQPGTDGWPSTRGCKTTARECAGEAIHLPNHPKPAITSRCKVPVRNVLQCAGKGACSDALQVKPLVRLNFPTTLCFKCIVSRNIEYEVAVDVSTKGRRRCLQRLATYSLTTRSLQFMLRAFCSDTNLDASKPVSSSTSRTWPRCQHTAPRTWTCLEKICAPHSPFQIHFAIAFLLEIPRS